MSITAETAKAHAKDPAVLCCRAEGGITIEPANLEDPAIFACAFAVSAVIDILHYLLHLHLLLV